jgi:ABC-type multidrug transport system fused ATPase/permease subunit
MEDDACDGNDVVLKCINLVNFSFLQKLATVPVISVGAVIYGKFVKRMQAKFQDHLAASTAIASESLSAIRTVRSFTRERKSEQQFSDAVVDR